MRNQKGITLVALVITIIVLLILAGVSISLVLGNNGVLTQASEAVITNEQATIKQDMDMAFADANMDYTTKQSMGTLNSTTEDLATILVSKLSNNASIGTISEVAGDKGATKVTAKYTVKSSKRVYDVSISVSGATSGEVTVTPTPAT